MATNNVTTVTKKEAGASALCTSILSTEKSQNGTNPKPSTRITTAQPSIFATESPCLAWNPHPEFNAFFSRPGGAFNLGIPSSKVLEPRPSSGYRIPSRMILA